MLLRLQKYDFALKFRPGRSIPLADGMSRCVLQGYQESEEAALEEQVHTLMRSLPAMDLEKIRTDNTDDSNIKALMSTVLQGWPNDKSEAMPQVREFWYVRDELTVVDGIVFKGQRIVIPKSLRKEMIKRIHRGNFGIEKCKQRARDSVYWPLMSKEIEDWVSNCEICVRNLPEQTKEPMISHDIPEYPWQRVATDLFKVHGMHTC